MLIYILIWISLLLCSWKKNNVGLMWVNIVFLSLFAGLRALNIGIDTINYYDIWNWIAGGGGDFVEPGWYLMNKGMQNMGGSYNLLLWIVSLITLIPMGKLAGKYSPNPSLSLFFYYSIIFLLSLNIMRQILAVSIVWIGYLFLVRGHWKKYLFWTLLAAMIHYTALCALFLVFVNKIRLSENRCFWWTLISFAGGFLLNANILSLFIGRYAVYLQDGQGFRTNLVSVYLLGGLMNAFYLFIYFTSFKEERNSWWMKIYFIGIILMNLTAQLELGTRLILYFTGIQIIVLPLYIRHNKISNKSLLYSLLILYAGILYMKLLIGDPLQIIPYGIF